VGRAYCPSRLWNLNVEQLTTDAQGNTIPVGQRIQTLALVDNEGKNTEGFGL